MTIRRVKTVYYPVQDVNSLASFYESALGLDLKFRDDNAWVEFKTGDASFALGSPDESPADINGAVVVFESDEFDNLIKRIEMEGGYLVAQRNMGDHGNVATCRDPQGNVFQVLVKK